MDWVRDNLGTWQYVTLKFDELNNCVVVTLKDENVHPACVYSLSVALSDENKEFEDYVLPDLLDQALANINEKKGAFNEYYNTCN